MAIHIQRYSGLRKACRRLITARFWCGSRSQFRSLRHYRLEVGLAIFPNAIRSAGEFDPGAQSQRSLHLSGFPKSPWCPLFHHMRQTPDPTFLKPLGARNIKHCHSQEAVALVLNYPANRDCGKAWTLCLLYEPIVESCRHHGISTLSESRLLAKFI